MLLEHLEAWPISPGSFTPASDPWGLDEASQQRGGGGNRTDLVARSEAAGVKRDAKAKVVASVWGPDYVQFLATLAVLPRSIWNNRMNSTVSSNTKEAKHLARQGTEQNLPPPPNRSDDLCLCFSLHPSSMCAPHHHHHHPNRTVSKEVLTRRLKLQ